MEIEDAGRAQDALWAHAGKRCPLGVVPGGELFTTRYLEFGGGETNRKLRAYLGCAHSGTQKYNEDAHPLRYMKV